MSVVPVLLSSFLYTHSWVNKKSLSLSSSRTIVFLLSSWFPFQSPFSRLEAATSKRTKKKKTKLFFLLFQEDIESSLLHLFKDLLKKRSTTIDTHPIIKLRKKGQQTGRHFEEFFFGFLLWISSLDQKTVLNPFSSIGVHMCYQTPFPLNSSNSK